MKQQDPPFLLSGLLLITLMVLAIFFVRTSSAVDCVQPGNTAVSAAFEQGKHITVNINSTQFSPIDYNCLVTAFSNWSTQNNANFSGVQFDVNYSPNILVTTNSNGEVIAGGDNVYQVNRSTVGVGGGGCLDCSPDDGIEWVNCRNLGGTWFSYPTCDCSDPSPIIVYVAGNGIQLSARSEGVLFDLNSDGTLNLLPWTLAGSDDAWLVLDRNGNGVIDNGEELFGNFTPQLALHKKSLLFTPGFSPVGRD